MTDGCWRCLLPPLPADAPPPLFGGTDYAADAGIVQAEASLYCPDCDTHFAESAGAYNDDDGNFYDNDDDEEKGDDIDDNDAKNDNNGHVNDDDDNDEFSKNRWKSNICVVHESMIISMVSVTTHGNR